MGVHIQPSPMPYQASKEGGRSRSGRRAPMCLADRAAPGVTATTTRNRESCLCESPPGPFVNRPRASFSHSSRGMTRRPVIGSAPRKGAPFARRGLLWIGPWPGTSCAFFFSETVRFMAARKLSLLPEHPLIAVKDRPGAAPAPAACGRAPRPRRIGPAPQVPSRGRDPRRPRNGAPSWSHGPDRCRRRQRGRCPERQAT